MKKIISTKNAPKAIGPYSQGIVTKNMIFVSGQIAINPTDNEMVKGGIEEETKRVIENIKAILNASGADLSNVVKTTVYLTDLNDFGKMNEIYARYFKENPPARATVEVKSLPKGAKVEIEAIAIIE